MKTNFFSNTAPVIPTPSTSLGAGSAKRSGGISRLAYDATIKAGAHVSRFLGKLGMTMLLLSPVVLSAQSVSGLLVEPGTVTFNVSWNKADVPGGKVWVFVDYNKGGGMERLPVTGAAASAGTAEWVNDKGAWVINSENVDNFSAMVTLSFNPQLAVTGACAYASNYPPEAEYITAQTIKFTGTPLYNLVLKSAGNDTIYRTSGTDYGIPRGYTIVSFTDKTGAPGIVNCIPPVTYTLTASASSFCAGDAVGVTFSLEGTENGRKYRLYRGSTAVGSEITGDGNDVSFGAFNVAGTYTAQSVADEVYCPIAMSGSHVVIENPLPADPDVNNATRNCPGTVTLSASSSLDAEIDWYADADATSVLHTGASYTTPEIKTSTTYYVQARVENTGCLSSARVPVLAEVNMEGCCHVPGTTSVTFADFSPCSTTVGSTWMLTDTRAGGNNNTYMVRMLADGRIWMVQGLKFGSCGTGTSTWRNDNSAANAAAKPTVYADAASTYVGHCRTTDNSGDGYIYNWPGVMNNVNAYYGSNNATFACTGTSAGTCSKCPATCQGICPTGWHVPTSAEMQDYASKCKQLHGTSEEKCWWDTDKWNARYTCYMYYEGSYNYCDYVWLWLSDYLNADRGYDAHLKPNLLLNTYDHGKNDAQGLRCVMNY